MTKTKVRALVRFIEKIHERAYRRGFHHGVVRQSDSSSDMNESAISAWRHSGIGTRTKPVCGVGVEMLIRDRILCETKGDERQLFLDLINQADLSK